MTDITLHDDDIDESDPFSNPWYRLLNVDVKLLRKDTDGTANDTRKRIWNSLIFESLVDSQRDFVLENTQFTIDDLKPLSENELKILSKEMAEGVSDQRLLDRLL